MSLVNGDLTDDPDPEAERESGWVGDEPWPGSAALDQDALDEEWCNGEGTTPAPRWVDEVIDEVLSEGEPER
jgi:hypothetical protein